MLFYRAHHTLQHQPSTDVRVSHPLMRPRPHIVAIHQPTQLLAGELEHILLEQARPGEALLRLNNLVIQSKPVHVPGQQLDRVEGSSDIQHTDRKLLMLNIDGTHCMDASCCYSGAKGAPVRRWSTSRCHQACRVSCPRGCATPRSAGLCHSELPKSH